MIISLFLGFFTKIADLLDEHGLVLFKGADILSGIMWGSLMLYLSILNKDIGALYVAIVLSRLLRGNIDYFNHRLALGILFVGLILFQPIINIYFFGTTFLLFTFVGLLKSKFGNLKILDILTRKNLYIIIIMIGLTIYDLNFIFPLLSYIANSVAYHTVKQRGKRNLPDY